MTRDEYIALLDAEVKRLTKKPGKILSAWQYPPSPLFVYASPTGYEGANCGCLTQIRRGNHYAYGKDEEIDNEMSDAIEKDDRLPLSGYLIWKEHLPIFAEWQLRLRDYWLSKGWISDYGEGL